MSAALELFVDRGYVATRLEDVASKAGVSKGTVYLYFANKEELFKAVVREGLVSPLAEMKDVIAQYQGGTFDLLRMLVRGWWERVGSTRLVGIPKLIFAEAGNFPEIARFYVAEVIEPGHRVVREIIERGVARGEFRKVDTEQVARLIAAPFVVLMMWRSALAQHADQHIEPNLYLDTHLDMLEHALRPE